MASYTGSHEAFGPAQSPSLNGFALPKSNAVPDEDQPLLGSRLSSSPGSKGRRRSMMVDVRRDWADLVLLSCYLITGLLDSASISIWGSFVSMQTGNSVYLGLGLAAPTESTRWIKSGVSIIAFCLGSFVFGRFHRYFSPKRRWVLCASFLVQMLLVSAAGAIVTFGPAGDEGKKDEITWNVLAPIALVAFQSCGQAVTSRAIGHNALTSVVLTTIFCDLFSDPGLFHLRNAERNRRAAASVLLVAGAISGGLLAHSRAGIAGALWTAAVLKLGIVVTWFFWPAEMD
ncbi:uncharacterized protein MKZ38_005121 [Zalerion maritima]|uniref:DUF1275 domain protein n=1 Tax=Zalerion maritima TaxID=339359 RepID=A0AAD5RRC4_9PEZI|nr:uncharacterized protein MKZ38_005121 [Zalerion maritima]